MTFVVFALLFVAFLHGGQDCSTVSLGISLFWCNGQYGSEARAPCAETHYVVDQELRHFFGQEILQTDACLAKVQHPVHHSPPACGTVSVISYLHISTHIYTSCPNRLGLGCDLWSEL